MKFLVLFATCVAAASAVELVTYPSGAVAPAKTPRSSLLRLLTLLPRVFMPDIPTDTPDGTDTTTDGPVTTEHGTDTTVTLMVPLLPTLTVPLPPPRPPRFLPLSKLTSPPTVLPLLLPLPPP